LQAILTPKKISRVFLPHFISVAAKRALVGQGGDYYRTILSKSPIFHGKRLFKTHLEVVEIEEILLLYPIFRSYDV
jgi:hypothetical protein